MAIPKFLSILLIFSNKCYKKKSMLNYWMNYYGWIKCDSIFCHPIYASLQSYVIGGNIFSMFMYGKREKVGKTTQEEVGDFDLWLCWIGFVGRNPTHFLWVNIPDEKYVYFKHGNTYRTYILPFILTKANRPCFWTMGWPRHDICEPGQSVKNGQLFNV